LVALDGGLRPYPLGFHVKQAGADAKLNQHGPLGFAYHRRHPISTIPVARITAHATVPGSIPYYYVVYNIELSHLNEAILDYRILRRRNLRQTSERSIKRYAIFAYALWDKFDWESFRGSGSLNSTFCGKRKNGKKIVFILMKQICHFIQLLQRAIH
jgi:hypothetical protein